EVVVDFDLCRWSRKVRSTRDKQWTWHAAAPVKNREPKQLARSSGIQSGIAYLISDIVSKCPRSYRPNRHHSTNPRRSGAHCRVAGVCRVLMKDSLNETPLPTILKKAFDAICQVMVTFTVTEVFAEGAHKVVEAGDQDRFDGPPLSNA